MKKFAWLIFVLILAGAGIYFLLNFRAVENPPISESVETNKLGFSEDGLIVGDGASASIRTYPNPNAKKTVVYFHGAGGRENNIVDDLAKDNKVFSPTYPASSPAIPLPTEKAFYQTVGSAINYAQDQGHDINEISVVGFSMGGSAGVYAAQAFPELKEVIIIGTYLEFVAVCQSLAQSLCDQLPPDYLDVNKLAIQTEAPILQYHSPEDEIVPYSQGKALFAVLASETKEFKDISGPHSGFDITKLVNYEL